MAIQAGVLTAIAVPAAAGRHWQYRRIPPSAPTPDLRYTGGSGSGYSHSTGRLVPGLVGLSGPASSDERRLTLPPAGRSGPSQLSQGGHGSSEERKEPLLSPVLPVAASDVTWREGEGEEWERRERDEEVRRGDREERGAKKREKRRG